MHISTHWRNSFVTTVARNTGEAVNTAMRHFRDKAGVEWQVFLTARGSDAVSREHFLPEAFREGWLVFESAQEKRRLAPVPANWESLSNEALASLCAKASPQVARAKSGGEAKSAAPAESLTPKPAESLKPKLKEAEQQLDRTLEEVCDKATAADLDTGQLIRVEESLALAAEAAKEAVSLRRKLKADSDQSARSPRAPAGGEGSATPHEPKP
ncbi:MAG TPA: hypothetical protein VGH98_20820 [Gemmatimonadaceae bacterium]|jgi:hypothetical protein